MTTPVWTGSSHARDDRGPAELRNSPHGQRRGQRFGAATDSTAGARLPISPLHADTDEGSSGLRGQVSGDLQRLPNATAHVWYERGGTRTLPVAGVHEEQLDLDDVSLPEGAGHYLCGPLPSMKAVRSALLDRGVPPRDVQYEVFGPDLWQADLVIEPTAG